MTKEETAEGNSTNNNNEDDEDNKEILRRREERKMRLQMEEEREAKLREEELQRKREERKKQEEEEEETRKKREHDRLMRKDRRRSISTPPPVSPVISAIAASSLAIPSSPADTAKSDRLKRMEERRRAREEEDKKAEEEMIMRKKEREERRRQEEERQKQLEQEEAEERERKRLERQKALEQEKENSIEGQTEKLEKLLKSENTTVEQILTQKRYREIVMEHMLPSQYEPLVDLLYRPESVITLLQFLVDEKASKYTTNDIRHKTNDEELREATFLMNCTCDIFEAKISRVVGVLFMTDDLVDTSTSPEQIPVLELFRFFVEKDHHTKLPPLNLVFIVRLLLALLPSCGLEMYQLMSNHYSTIIPHLVKHIGNERVATLTWKLIDSSLKQHRKLVKQLNDSNNDNINIHIVGSTSSGTDSSSSSSSNIGNIDSINSSTGWCCEVINYIALRIDTYPTLVVERGDYENGALELDNIAMLVKDILNQHEKSGPADAILARKFTYSVAHLFFSTMNPDTFTPTSPTAQPSHPTHTTQQQKQLLQQQKPHFTTFSISLVNLLNVLLEHCVNHKTHTAHERCTATELPLIHAVLHKNKRSDLCTLFHSVWTYSPSKLLRFSWLQLVQKLVHANYELIDDVIMRGSPIVQDIVKMFFDERSNDVMHSVVVDILKTIVERAAVNLDFAYHLLRDTHLVDRLIEALESPERINVCPNITGHVISICKIISSLNKRDLVYCYPQWNGVVAPLLADVLKAVGEKEEKLPMPFADASSPLLLDSVATTTKQQTEQIASFGAFFFGTTEANGSDDVDIASSQKSVELLPITEASEEGAHQQAIPQCTEGVTCDSCHATAPTCKCLQCEESFCDECNIAQHKTPKRKLHERVPLLLQQPQPQPQPQPPKCDNCSLPSAAVVHCEECDENLCSKCDGDQHQSAKRKPHQRGDVQEYLKAKRAQVPLSSAPRPIAPNSARPTIPSPMSSPTKPSTKTLSSSTPVSTPSKQPSFKSTLSFSHESVLSSPSASGSGGRSTSIASSPVKTNMFGVCAVCNQSIDFPLQSMKVKGLTYHKSCFCCSLCGKTITNYGEKDDKFYCPSCYKKVSSPVCVACNKPLASSPVFNALNNVWHQSCFACPVCQKVLAGQNFDFFEGKPYCRVHHPNFKEEIRDFGTCAGCELVIASEAQGCTVENNRWHKKCFVCARCKKPAASAYKRSDDGTIYCHSCYDVTFPPPCAQCLQPIRFGLVNHGGVKLHATCFRCASCRMVFNSTNAAHELLGAVYCYSCFNKRAEPMPKIQHPAHGEESNITCRSCHLRITSEFFVHVEEEGAFYHGHCYANDVK